MLVRKQSGNPEDFFDKSFSLYQQGFSANGEFHLWKNHQKLDRPGQASSTDQFKILFTEDYDGKIYTALYEQFQVNSFSLLLARFLSITFADQDNSYQ